MARPGWSWAAAALVGGAAVAGWFAGVGDSPRAPEQLTAQDWRDEGSVGRAVLGYHVAACRSSDPTSPDLAEHCFAWHGLRHLRAWAEDDLQFQSGAQRYAEVTVRAE
jgi:hypothetical protein